MKDSDTPSAPGHTDSPDVSACLWSSESGISVDPLVSPVFCGFVPQVGWSSKANPLAIPQSSPRTNLSTKSPYVHMIYGSVAVGIIAVSSPEFPPDRASAVKYRPQWVGRVPAEAEPAADETESRIDLRRSKT